MFSASPISIPSITITLHLRSSGKGERSFGGSPYPRASHACQGARRDVRSPSRIERFEATRLRDCGGASKRKEGDVQDERSENQRNQSRVRNLGNAQNVTGEKVLLLLLLYDPVTGAGDPGYTGAPHLVARTEWRAAEMNAQKRTTPTGKLRAFV